MKLHLLLTLSLLLLAGCSKQETTKEAPPVVSVQVASLVKTTIPISVKGPATIFPRAQANVTSRITAPIRELRAQKGDSVHDGQILAVLENADLVAQRDQSLSAAENASASLQKTINGTLPTDLERARAQLATAEAALVQAKKNLDRRQKLFSEGAVSSKDLLQSQTDFATAQASFDSARKSLDYLREHSQEADLHIAQSQLSSAEAQVKGATAMLGYSRIYAPFSGKITEQFAYPGDVAQPAAPIFTVMDLSRLIARAQITETDAVSVRVGQRCHFFLNDARQTIWMGRITVVSAAVDSTRRTVESWCEITPPVEGLKAGLFGTVEIETGSIPDALIIPVRAVNLQEGTSHGSVLVVDRESVGHLRQVETGTRTGDSIQVQSGLRAGDVVVTDGGYGLEDGTHLRVSGNKQEPHQ
jgi:HlyD family secretion protein